MELLLLLGLLLLFEVAALRWGHDSRDPGHAGTGGLLPESGQPPRADARGRAVAQQPRLAQTQRAAPIPR